MALAGIQLQGLVVSTLIRVLGRLAVYRPGRSARFVLSIDSVPTCLQDAVLTGTGTQLAAALCALLGASTLCRQDWIGDEQGEPDRVEGTTMRLGDPAGGVLTFERATLAFTPAEFARARALRDLAPAAAHGAAAAHRRAEPPPGEPPVTGSQIDKIEVEDVCPFLRL